MDRRRGRRMLVGAVAALGLVIVLAVAAAGPIRFGPARWVPGDQPVQRPLPTAAAPSLGPALPPSGSPVPEIVLRVILTVIVVLAAVAVVVALAVWLWRLWGARRRLLRRAGAAAVEAGPTVASAAAVAAPVIRRGIDRALDVLGDRDREPSDAVVQAWLGLEEAASAGGAPRRPAETPSEHVARIIARFDADRGAADTLLRLYQDVRFGAHPADAATVDAAVRCLRALKRSWHDASADGPAAAPASVGTES